MELAASQSRRLPRKARRATIGGEPIIRHPTASSLTFSTRAKQTQRNIYKIIVVGDSGVGKTCLTYRFCEGKYLENTRSTIGMDLRCRTLKLSGDEVTLQLWDTAGQERFGKSEIVQQFYRDAHGAVLVYDVSDMSSFRSLTDWIAECRKKCDFDIPCMLVGNKCDQDAVVSTNVAQKFADRYNLPLIETSALLDGQCNNVELIFTALAYKVKNRTELAALSTSGANRDTNVPPFNPSNPDELPFRVTEATLNDLWFYRCCLFS